MKHVRRVRTKNRLTLAQAESLIREIEASCPEVAAINVTTRKPSGCVPSTVVAVMDAQPLVALHRELNPGSRGPGRGIPLPRSPLETIGPRIAALGPKPAAAPKWKLA